MPQHMWVGSVCSVQVVLEAAGAAAASALTQSLLPPPIPNSMQSSFCHPHNSQCFPACHLAAQAYRPLQPGEVIYKGHHSYDLMRQLQLGILYSIAQAAALVSWALFLRRAMLLSSTC